MPYDANFLLTAKGNEHELAGLQIILLRAGIVVGQIERHGQQNGHPPDGWVIYLVLLNRKKAFHYIGGRSRKMPNQSIILMTLWSILRNY